MLVPTMLVVVLLGGVQLHAGMSGLLPVARIVGSVTVTTAILATLPFTGAPGQNSEKGWVNLFNGKTLEGWEQRGGKAKYAVEDGAIVGTTVPRTPNSFLCTKKVEGDFVLELEFKVDPRLNSGIQIRSNSVPGYGKGVVHGYQVEIDPSERSYSCGVYDESRRGWLQGPMVSSKVRFMPRPGSPVTARCWSSSRPAPLAASAVS